MSALMPKYKMIIRYYIDVWLQQYNIATTIR